MPRQSGAENGAKNRFWQAQDQYRSGNVPSILLQERAHQFSNERDEIMGEMNYSLGSLYLTLGGCLSRFAADGMGCTSEAWQPHGTSRPSSTSQAGPVPFPGNRGCKHSKQRQQCKPRHHNLPAFCFPLPEAKARAEAAAILLLRSAPTLEVSSSSIRIGFRRQDPFPSQSHAASGFAACLKAQGADPARRSDPGARVGSGHRSPTPAVAAAP
jgi:hypothetical protein